MFWQNKTGVSVVFATAQLPN
uniref:Uncharacterized protein n=1 Tax=Anopheles quadriannulatus TaxID=34691 RepID=A0A182XTQ4_ANOQN